MAHEVVSREEFEKLKAEFAALKKAATPPQPFVPQPHETINPLDRLSIPNSATADLVRAVGNDMVRGIVDDFRGGLSMPSSMIPRKREPEAKRGTGWQEQQPIRPPPGLEYVDRQVMAQEALDRAEIAALFGRAIDTPKDD